MKREKEKILKYVKLNKLKLLVLDSKLSNLKIHFYWKRMKLN
jgi:hypothetical protein